MAETTAEAVARVLGAIDGLERRAETVEDDGQYVIDLARAWRLRLGSLAGADRTLTRDQGHAIDLAIAEAAVITDPHRAIDWLSTLPQLAVLVLGAP